MQNKFTRLLRLTVYIAVTGIISACGPVANKGIDTDDTANHKQTVMVFAAASLTDALSEIIGSFEAAHDVDVKTNMASSGTLARQIEQGGDPDVYISASTRWANYIDSLGYMVKGHKSEIAQNRLALIAPLNSPLRVDAIDSNLNFLSLLGPGRLSIGDPAHVPAGKYARQSLEYFGWYNQLGNKTLPAKDVRSALMVVEMQEAPAGIVYRTDAQRSNMVRILNLFPEKSHGPVVYVAGLCKDNKPAKDFFIYLNSGDTKAIWIKHGFKK